MPVTISQPILEIERIAPGILQHPERIPTLPPSTLMQLLKILPNLQAAPDTESLDGSSVKNPYAFFREVLKWGPTPKALELGYKRGLSPDQEKIVESVVKNKYTAVTAGRGTGKTFVAGGIAMWYYQTFGMLSSNTPEKRSCGVITVAPSWNLVRTVLWGHLRSLFYTANGRVSGELLQTEIKNPRSPNWNMFGIATDTNVTDISATRLHGFHRDFVLIIVEEATGIPEEIWKALEGSILESTHRLLAIDNPTDTSSGFYKRCHGGLFNVLRMDASEGPNCIHDDEGIIPHTATRTSVEEMKESYGGEESQGYLALVRGMWPDSKSNSVIPLKDLRNAQDLWRLYEDDPNLIVDDGRGLVLGIDVAGGGEDKTIISACHNGRLWPVDAFQEQDTNKIATRLRQKIIELMKCPETYPRAVGIDATAFGQGPYDDLVKMTKGLDQALPANLKLWPFNFGHNAWDDKTYNRLKDQLWWELREAILAGKLAIPSDEDAGQYCILNKADSPEQQLARAIWRHDDRMRIDIWDKREPHRPETYGLPSKSPDVAHSLMIAHMVWKHTPTQKKDLSPKTVEEYQKQRFQAKLKEEIKKGVARINQREGKSRNRRGRFVF